MGTGEQLQMPPHVRCMLISPREFAKVLRSGLESCLTYNKFALCIKHSAASTLVKQADSLTGNRFG